MLDEFSLTGRVAVVTGGARGLGAEMLDALAAAGAHVAALDLLAEDAKAVAGEIAARRGVKGYGGALDVTDAAATRAALDAVERELGPIDVFVANAGIVEHVPTEELTDDGWRRVMGVNLDGVFYGARDAGRRMLARGTGSIILVASMSGLIVNRPQPQAAYNASKAAVIQLARSMAAEWAPRGVRVNALAPGYMLTKLTEVFFEAHPDYREMWERDTPMGRMGDPRDLRGPVVYLASDASAFATGTTLLVDGGFTIW